MKHYIDLYAWVFKKTAILFGGSKIPARRLLTSI
ncbi:unnamed protein product [Amaranthus hypochondriacus]